jgi:hypothetical protein
MTTSDPVAAAARACAQRLAAGYGPGLAAEVEAELHARTTRADRPSRYADPVSLASLIVAIATLAWTVYADLRQKGREPAPDVVTRRVRVALRERGEAHHPDSDRITEIVITEINEVTRGQG